MKKILLSLLSLVSVAASAQLTQVNHAPTVGDAGYSTRQFDSTGINTGVGGAGQSWSFSPSGLNILSNYTVSASTNVAFNPADVKVSSASNNSLYYNSTANDLKYYGGDLSINSFDMSVKYASPAVYAIYPMALNTTTTSITSGTVNLTSPFSVNQAFTGTCTVLADGTGTLVLPAKTFTNVIRVVTSQTIVAGSAATVYLKNYDYFSIGAANKAPMISIQTSTINAIAQPSSSQTIALVQDNYNLVSVKENQKASIDLTLFPNPATNIINFNTSAVEAVKVVAYDLTGKSIATETLEAGKGKMNTSGFNAGIYLYSVLGKDNEVLKTGKFNIAK